MDDLHAVTNDPKTDRKRKATHVTTDAGSKVLVVDNFDSFVYTIVGYLEQLGTECHVIRNDIVIPQTVGEYDGVLISPGPGTPENSGKSIDVIHACAQKHVPMFGVCLGLQALAVAYGASVTRAPELVHGKVSDVFHDNTGVFAGISNPFRATRYHSLAVDEKTLPPELIVDARTDNGIIMGLRHATLPLSSVQFHPESVMTSQGHRLLANWLATTGLSGAIEASATMSPLIKEAAF